MTRPTTRPAWLRTARRWLLLALLGYVTLCALMFMLQRHLLYHPTAADGEAAATLPRADGSLIRYVARPRTGDQAVLYLGGNAEHPGAAVQRLAQALPGHAVYGLHYRGYAGSDGQPTEAGLRADADAWLRHLRTQHPRLLLVGRSLGSGLALRLAAEHGAERLVLVTPYDSIAAVAADHYPWLPVNLLLQDRFEAWRDAPRVRTPTLLLLAEHDEVVPTERGRALLQHFSAGVASARVLAGTGHNSISAHPDYWPALVR